jgi:hypothetical protein
VRVPHIDAFASHEREDDMNISGSLLRPLQWIVTLALIAFMAGCGGGGGGDSAPSSPGPGAGAGATLPTVPGVGGGVDGNGHGPNPLNMLTANNFAVLAETEITSMAPSVITGDLGLSPAVGANIQVTCAEVIGVIYVTARGNPGCMTVAPGLLSQAVADGHGAWHDAVARVADYTEVGDGNIGGLVLPPATYRWSTGVHISSDVTLQGGPDDVWIFLIEHDLIVDPGVRIVLDGGALAQNVYWVTVIDNVLIGENAQFKGVILAETFIDMKAGASIDGRLLAAQAIHLEGNTITAP